MHGRWFPLVLEPRAPVWLERALAVQGPRERIRERIGERIRERIGEKIGEKNR